MALIPCSAIQCPHFPGCEVTPFETEFVEAAINGIGFTISPNAALVGGDDNWSDKYSTKQYSAHVTTYDRILTTSRRIGRASIYSLTR